ncbi:HPP family protein [Bacillus subtilis]|nr:HPP family protein [Bacillus sp. RHFS10]TYS09049.1 HPP family protein [Bacillus subtilis]
MENNFFLKMKGKGKTPLQVNSKDAVTGLIGGFITILALASLTAYTSSLWLMAPFGASCVLVFSAWNAPLSQPRNVIGGHFISALTGIVVFEVFGAHPWTFALGTGLAICLMMLTKTTHPPAGADPIVVIQGAYAWSYLVFPVLIGSVIIVIIALVINNLRKNRQYPAFWL